MDVKLLCYDYFIVVFLLMIPHGLTLFEDDYDDTPSFGRCPWIRNKLKNGRVKLRSRGRIAKFLCDPGYELAGKRFATCVRGQWNNPIPVCVARGCSRKPAIRNGRITEMYRGAMLVYDCNPGYSLDGSISIHCDGRRWNSDPPACVVTTSDSATSCDFEDPDLCGWSHDPTHDFDWKRNQFSTPSGHVGTGPSYDHTFGIGKGGFYLYLEASSPRKENDTARLFSPVYSQDLSGGCFIFWYHMYGGTTGGLRVYLKPESHVFGESSPKWEKFGDQGNKWLRGHISIPPLHENFQLVIEGIRGTGYVGDSAIDDVQLTKSDCESVENDTETVADTVAESCRGRCREPDEDAVCGCNENCVKADTCCSDYATICTSGNDTSAENPDEPLPVELGTTKNLVTVVITNIPRAENAETETATSTEKVITMILSEFTKTTTPNISSSTTSTDSPTSSTISSTSSTIPSTSSTISSTSSTVSSSTLPSTSIVSTTILSTMSTESAANVTNPVTSISTVKSSTTELTTSTTQVNSQTITTNSSVKVVPEIITTIVSSTTIKVLSTQAPTLSSIVSTTGPTVETTTSLPMISTLENTTAVPENVSSKFISPEVVSTTSSEIVNISSSTPSTSITSTPSTRKTYNLRPRTQRTTPTTTKMTPVYVSSTSTSVTTISPTTVQAAVNTTNVPVVVTEKGFSLFYTSVSPMTASPKTSFQTSSTTISPSTRASTSTSTRQTTTISTRTVTTKKYSWITTAKVDTTYAPRPTNTLYQKLTTQSSVLNDASKTSNDSQPTITIASISVVCILGVAGGIIYYMKKQKVKRQSKLSDDSEMRFLSENEIMEYSDPSVLDRILVK